MDNDFHESIDFDFKPINKGLGFHQRKTEVKKTPEVQKNNVQQRVSLNKDLEKRIQQRNQRSIAKAQMKSTVLPEASLPKKEVKAGLFARSAAFLIDLIFISANLVLTMFLLLNLTKIELSTIFTLDFLLLSSGLFLFYYVLYFSVLEVMPWSTFGKLACKLKVVSKKGYRLSFSESLFRTAISALISPLVWLDLHGRFSETKVMSNN